jgi:TolB-like protein
VTDSPNRSSDGTQSSGSGYQRFFAELKRRKVFQVAAVYGAGMFGVLQGADVLVEALHLPESLVTYAAVLGLLGFPMALFVAWVFERSPDGLIRTEDAAPGELTQFIEVPPAKRWPVGLAAAAGTTLLLVGAWLVLGRPAADPAGQGGNIETAAAGAPTRPVDTVANLSIAVLPFEDMSEAGDKEYFSDGLSEELIDALARVDNLQVAARTSSFAFKDGAADIRTIADSLGVANVLEGSVRASGDRLRITAQLIQASDGFHLWTETYDRELTDVFEVQEEIAEAIAIALLGTLGLEHGADFSVARTDIKAYEQYLLGRAFVSRRGDALHGAEEHFRAALAIDSMYAPAWGGLAEVYALYPYYASVDFEESLALSEDAARRALALDPNSANAHVALGSVLRERRQWKDAERELRRAVQLAPESSEAHGELSQYLLAVGDFDEAMDAARRSLALDPLSHHKLGLVGVYGLAARHYEEAEEVLWRVRGFTISTISLTQYLAYEGRFDEAERAARIEPLVEDLLTSMVAAARAEPGSMERQRGLDLVGGDARLPMAQGGGPMQAIWLVILGEEDEALTQLEELFEGPVIGLEVIGMPMFDPIRDHSRFQAIMDGLKLPA